MPSTHGHEQSPATARHVKLIPSVVLPTACRKAINRERVNAAYRTKRSVLPAPLIIHLEHTSACNLRCIACPQYYKRGRLSRHLDPAVIDKLKPILPLAEKIFVSGSGEPFLYPWIDDALSLYRDYGLKVTTTTNLTCLTPRNLALIRDSITSLNVSIDGATRETFEGIRRGAKFQKILDNVRTVRAACPDLSMTMGVTVMRQNVQELPEMVSLAKSLGFDRITVGRMIPLPVDIPHTRRDDILLYPNTANRCFDRARQRAAELSIPITLPKQIPGAGNAELEATRLYEGEWFPSASQQRAAQFAWWTPQRQASHRATAPPPRRRIRFQTRPDAQEPIPFHGVCDLLHCAPFIHLNGDVATCSLRSRHSLGNLLKVESFYDIWNSEDICALRDTYWEGWVPRHCYNCQYLLMEGALGLGSIVGEVDVSTFKSEYDLGVVLADHAAGNSAPPMRRKGHYGPKKSSSFMDEALRVIDIGCCTLRAASTYLYTRSSAGLHSAISSFRRFLTPATGPSPNTTDGH